MPTFKSFAIHIECDGEKLEEFEVREGEDIVTCWIESKVGKTFDIKIENKSSLDCKCTLQLDGTECNWPIVYPQKTRLVEGVNAGEDGEVLPFVFCHIELTDDDELLAETFHSAEKLGTIEVKCEYVIVDRTNSKVYSADDSKFLKAGPVHERAKKMSTHRVGLHSTVKKTAPKTEVTTKPLDPNNPGPVATFCFKYRPRDFLVAQGFVEPIRMPDPTPSPEHVPIPKQAHGSQRKRRRGEDKESNGVTVKEEAIDLDDDDEEDEEIRRLEAELASRREKKQRRLGIKKEPKQEPLVPLIIGEDGVIDLTQD